jgi:hypothetical protein
MNDRLVFNNFDLHIGQGQDGIYPISVHYSPAGETMDPVLLPIACDDEPMRDWLRRLREGFTERDELLALGQRLASYLLPPGPVRDLYQRSLGMAEAKGLRLRLRLRISPPELAALPWEYTYDEGIGDFLSLNPRTALVRYHSQPVPPRSIASHRPVPILVVISNPPDVRPLDTAREIRNLIKALRRLLEEDGATIDVLWSGLPQEQREIEALVADQAGTRLLPDPASADGLRNALRREYRVIHYVGHGGFDEEMGGGLVLAGDQGRGILVGARTLARELRGSSVAVIVLNACQSATESTARSYMGLAPNLIRAGVPAVVAMQYAIADSSAVSFTRALYRALADGWPLDAAVTEGRKAISARLTEDDADWGIPVLFMRSSDGVLWKEEAGEMDGKVSTPPASPGADDQGRGDRISARIGNVGRGAQVAVGKQITQTMAQAPAGLTGAERAEIDRLLAQLESQLAGLDIPADKKLVGQEFVGQLGQELTKTDTPPDASTIKVAGEWLLKNVPALAGTIASVFLNPIVGKVVEAAGDIAFEWVKQRFGGGV